MWHTYLLECYGGEQIDHHQQTYLHKWVPRLLKRFIKMKKI